MNDRIPGATWDNPVWYGKFRIWLTDQHPYVRGNAYAYVHDDDDESGERYGYAQTVDECKAEIDERWPDCNKL